MENKSKIRQTRPIEGEPDGKNNLPVIWSGVDFNSTDSLKSGDFFGLYSEE